MNPRPFNWKFTLFLLLAAAMTLTVSYKLVRAESTRRNGTLFRCQILGFDPGDPFRGSYLQFTMPSQAQRSTLPDGRGVGMVFVTLRTGTDGSVIFDELRPNRPASGDYLEVNGPKHRFRSYNLAFQPPFERWFVPEKVAKQAEKLLQKAQRNNRAILLFRAQNGFAVIEDIEINGQSLSRLVQPAAESEK